MTLAVAQIVIVRAVGPVESGIALGLSIVLYAVGNTVGSAVVGVLFRSLTIGHTVLPSLAAFRWAFALSGLAAALAATLCLPLARQRQARGTLPGETVERSLGASLGDSGMLLARRRLSQAGGSHPQARALG